ncbi:MAG: hypothetical protein IAG10_08750 [Planctomycetaceae bacterium]|nr:hypothetical protein [Planctomycetaceae bacterium]
MDHADYQQKYERPYSDKPLDKWSRMAKQMMDARHVSDDSGTYIGGAGSNFRQNPAGGAEVGVTNYSTPWLSSKLALAGQLNSGAGNAFAGVNSAVHVSTPTRVAPFIGAGLFGGVDIASVINTLDSDDDDVDVEVENTKTEFLGAIYPEAGVHVWLTGRTRLSASASYWMTTSGRHDDFWYYGLGLTFSFGPEGRTSAPGEVLRENEFANRLLEEREQRGSLDDARRGSPDPAVSLTAGLTEEANNNHESPRPDEQPDQEPLTDFLEQEELRSPSVLDRAFPPPPLLLPPPPRSRVLPPQRSPGYVEPPTD